jgi:hypothetical protein
MRAFSPAASSLYRFALTIPGKSRLTLKSRVRSLIGTGSRQRGSVLQATLRQSSISMSERRVRNSGVEASQESYGKQHRRLKKQRAALLKQLLSAFIRVHQRPK